MKFRRKSGIVEAVQWFHIDEGVSGVEAFKVRAPESICTRCEEYMENHGWVPGGVHGHRVCPGDWIVEGEERPYNPKDFELTYERVKDEDDDLLDHILETQRRINAEHEEFTEDKARRKRDFVQFCVDCQKYNADTPSLLGGREEACSNFEPKTEED